MTEYTFRKLAYGYVLFSEEFWNSLCILLLARTKKSKEAVYAGLLPYIEEVKRIFADGSAEEREAVIAEVEKVKSGNDTQKKTAWIVFFQEFIEAGLKETGPRRRVVT